MNELLRRGVWIRKPGAPPLDSLRSRERRHGTDAPRLRDGVARRARGGRGLGRWSTRSSPTSTEIWSRSNARSSLIDRRRRRRVLGRHRRLRPESERVRARCCATRSSHAVLGNHDLAAVENFGVEYFNDAARAAIGWTQRVLDEASRAVAQRASVRTALSGVSAGARRAGQLFRIHPRQSAPPRAPSNAPTPRSSSSATRISREYWVRERRRHDRPQAHAARRRAANSSRRSATSSTSAASDSRAISTRRFVRALRFRRAQRASGCATNIRSTRCRRRCARPSSRLISSTA